MAIDEKEFMDGFSVFCEVNNISDSKPLDQMNRIFIAYIVQEIIKRDSNIQKLSDRLDKIESKKYQNNKKNPYDVGRK